VLGLGTIFFMIGFLALIITRKSKIQAMTMESIDTGAKMCNFMILLIELVSKINVKKSNIILHGIL
jgi:hypothetical protein